MSVSKKSEGELNPGFVWSSEDQFGVTKPPSTIDDIKSKYEPGEGRRMFRNVILISFSFTCLFTAFNAMANLQSSINSKDGLGTYSLSTLYASLVVSSMFLPAYLIKRFTVKWTLVVAMFGYSVYIAAQFYPEFYTLIPGAVILGFCGAPLWSAKCTYLTHVGNQYAALVGDTAEVVIVRFFGIFFLFFQSSQVWGNLISSAVLSIDDDNKTKDLNTCGVNFCPDTNDDDDDDDDDDDNEDMTTIYILAGIFLVSSLVAAAIVTFLVDPLTRYGEKDRVGSNSNLTGLSLMSATFRQMVKPYQILLIPLTIWSGMEQGFFGAEYTAGYITCSWGVSKVGYVLICYGVVDAIASITFGPIIRFTGRAPVFIFGALLHIGLVIWLLVWKPTPDESIIFFVIAGLWGVCDAIWQTQINAFYGVIFPQDEEASFSNYRLWESIGFIIAYILTNFVCVKPKLYILLGVISSGMLGYLIIEVKERKKI